MTHEQTKLLDRLLKTAHCMTAWEATFINYLDQQRRNASKYSLADRQAVKLAKIHRQYCSTRNP